MVPVLFPLVRQVKRALAKPGERSASDDEHSPPPSPHSRAAGSDGGFDGGPDTPNTPGSPNGSRYGVPESARR